ncbi:MAG: CDP-alcohol phosphatidyltransferase family protein [Candidatus Nanoarchaeia archaeon]|nr:CDP-alcohol phosphatidyltransferase family protein [Candidatus Nanoarchaeia archaeon]MDD5587605.1 CDP-alcohol phosphatidyltransferase family protein [Candidatus Nanoarchaeia archaeon]
MKEKITLADLKKDRHGKCKNLPIEFKPLSRVSPYVSYFFIKFLPFTPNQVSFMWGILGLISVLVMSFGGYWNLLTGILIFHLSILLDYVDGDMARALKKKTIGGTYLDAFFSWTLRALLMLGLGTGLFNYSNNIIYYYLGIWCCILLLIDNLTKLKVHETMVSLGKYDLLKKLIDEREENYEKGRKDSTENWKQTSIFQKIKFYLPRFLTPNGMFSLLFFSIIFNFSQYYLILMSIIVLPFFIRNFIAIYKRIGNIANN